VALLFIVDVNSYKPRLEAAVSEALGMDVSIGGQLQIDLFSELLITVEDINIRNRGKDVVSARQARVGVDSKALLKREIRINKIMLNHPGIKIERTADGTFNFAQPEKVEDNLPTLDLAGVFISDGVLFYKDIQSGQELEAEECHVEMNNLLYSGGKVTDLLKSLSFTAQFSCGQIQIKNFTMSDLQFVVEGKNGVFDFNPVTMDIFGAQGSGSIQADFHGEIPHYNLRYSLPGFQIEEFFKLLSPEKVSEGLMDFSINLSTQGKTSKNMKQALDGKVLLKGNNLILKGSDPDEKIAQFDSIQNFNLVDIGASLIVGPLGLLVTKGYNLFSILEKSKGSSEIRTFVSDWKVERGVAQAEDVAMATNKNRMVLKGQLDFDNEKFNEVTLAVVDAKGCVMVQQKIRGPFENPIIEQPNILRTISGPLRSLFKKGRDFLPGGECEVFYAGSVQPPL
jgi:AsmA protein